LDVLRRVRLQELVRWSEKAILLESAHLPAAAMTAIRNSSSKRVQKMIAVIKALSEQEREERLWSLDQQFNAAKYAWVSQFDVYIKTHPDEFVHEASRKP
jgi:flagellar motor component MotA